MKTKKLRICLLSIIAVMMMSCGNYVPNEEVQLDASGQVTEAASTEVDISYGNSLDTASEPESDPEPESETMTEDDKSEDSESYDDPQFTIMDPDLDIKDWDYFTSQDYDNQHFGADLFAYDHAIMG